MNVAMQVSRALGLAVLGTIAAARSRSLLAGGAPMPGALAGGYRLAFAITAALVAEVMLRTGRTDDACAAASQALGTERMVHGLLRECGAFDGALIRRHPDLQEARDFHERYPTAATREAPLSWGSESARHVDEPRCWCYLPALAPLEPGPGQLVPG